MAELLVEALDHVPHEGVIGDRRTKVDERVGDVFQLKALVTDGLP
jgi:hypothetical protein